nr:hypothetical protein [Tanacetum cinerariifolium]
MKKATEEEARKKAHEQAKKKKEKNAQAKDEKQKSIKKSCKEKHVEETEESEEELKKLRKVKIKRAEEDKNTTKKVTYPTCITGSPPKALFDTMNCLTEESKRCLKQMGFERYINFSIVEFSSTLAYHVIENFHTPSMELILQKGSIKATRQKVHDILGIPMGNTKLQDLKQRDANDPFIVEWEEQYSHLQKPTPSAIALQISENGGRVPTKLLKCIKEEDDIAEIDWCGFILDCLHTDLNIIRHRPAIRSRNTMMMTKRINMETSQRCLGSLKHHGEFDLEEEQNGMDLYEGLDVYIEPLSDRIPVTKEAKWNSKGEGNIKDMGKGTEEGGSEANESGEKDEDDVNIENEFNKVNEKDDEEAVSMDVDDPNKKMKEKEADKEKVSDSIEKEQQVESEKEKQYEADKVEKVHEIQDEHNRLTHDL